MRHPTIALARCSRTRLLGLSNCRHVNLLEHRQAELGAQLTHDVQAIAPVEATNARLLGREPRAANWSSSCRGPIDSYRDLPLNYLPQWILHVDVAW